MGRCVEGRGDVEDSMGETGERVGDTDRETQRHRETSHTGWGTGSVERRGWGLR